MDELTHPEVVYSPRSIQLWRTLWNWLDFFFQVFLQILRAVGPQTLSSPSHTFKPLPLVELPETTDPPPAIVEIPVGTDAISANEPIQKLTVVLDLDETLVCAYETSSLPPLLLNKATEAGLKWFELECVSSDKVVLDLDETLVCAYETSSLPPLLLNKATEAGLKWFELECVSSDKVVLDLDETLVCAYETSSLPPLLLNKATEAGLKWFELECVSSDKDKEGKLKINYVTVFERPGLDEFLNQLSEFAELVLFTAGLEGYARPLVDRIDTENRFSLRPRLFAGKQYQEHVKDLSCITNDPCRIVIVDNNPFSFLLQPLNGIPCIPFSAGQSHDTQLLDVLLPLLKYLSQQNDVRPVLSERFHMPEWFQKQGIPASGMT